MRKKEPLYRLLPLFFFWCSLARQLSTQASPSGSDLYIPQKCSEESAVKCTVSDSGWQEAYDMFLSLLFFPAKWWKQQFGPGVRDIIKEKGCLQLLHLAGNCQLTLTKKGISALAAAFKGSVIRWHYKYRIVHGGGGVGTSGSLTWQFCFSACSSKARTGLSRNKISSLSTWDSYDTHLNCKCRCLHLKLLETAALCG